MKDLLFAEVRRLGTRTALAQEMGIGKAYLGDVLLDKRPPGPAILKWLGLERQGKVITYTYKKSLKKRKPKDRKGEAP